MSNWNYITILNEQGYAIGRYYKPNDFFIGAENINIHKNFVNTTKFERLLFLRNIEIIETELSFTFYLTNKYNIKEFCKDTNYTICNNKIDLGENKEGGWISGT